MGFTLKSFAGVGLVVIPNVNDEAALTRFNGMKLVVILMIVTNTDRNTCEPLPALAVVAGLTNPDFLPLAPESLADIQKSAVRKLRRPVWAVDDRWNALRPSNATIG